MNLLYELINQNASFFDKRLRLPVFIFPEMLTLNVFKPGQGQFSS